MCFFTSTPARGGGEKWHFEFSSSLFQNGHPVKILRIASILKREGVRLISMNFSADMKVAGIAIPKRTILPELKTELCF